MKIKKIKLNLQLSNILKCKLKDGGSSQEVMIT